MSERKKVIHVKDLIIQAENVRIEPYPRPSRPFYGPNKPRQAEEKAKKKHKDDK